MGQNTMDSQITMYITLVSVSGVLTVFLGLYAFQKREEIPGVKTFILYTVAMSIYIFAYAFELASSSLEEIKIWTIIEYIGMPFAAVLGLLIVMQYIGKNVSRRMTAAMFAIPCITLVMVATNDYHHLFYQSVQLREGNALPFVKIEIAEWYIVHGAYTFGCMLAGIILLLGRWRQTKKAYQLQLFTLILGQLIPMISAYLYLIGVTPVGIDPVPVVICITAAMYIWAIVTTKMLMIIPIAKEILFESIGEGVIVLDTSERLIDYNRAAAAMFPSLHITMIGKKLDEVWTELTGSVFPVARRMNDMREEMVWSANGEIRYCQVRSSPVNHRSGEQAGSLLMLIDVTEQKRLQQQLEQLAFYDGMTQIYNRTQFIQRSRELLNETFLQGKTMSMILFDIDHFKNINDTYGHETGDRLIVHVVTVCQSVLPADALFARYGGEEFVLALPSATLQSAGELADRMRAALEAEPLMTSHGPISVTSSFGAAQSAGESETLEQLLRNTDAALYASKRNGRNRVSLHAG